MQNSNLLKVFGVLLLITTVIYGSMILPPFFQEKQREQKQASQKRFWLAEGKKAGDEMIRQVGAEERRIDALPITRAEKKQLKREMAQRAYAEMERVHMSEYKRPFNMEAP